MVLITIVTGAYKPTYNWGASHCSISEIHETPKEIGSCKTQTSLRSPRAKMMFDGTTCGFLVIKGEAIQGCMTTLW